MEENEEESWIKQYWRPFMAWQYAAICLFDFMIAPILTGIFFKLTGGTYIPWVPLTLQQNGFFHISMMTIIGISAYTRGQEKITKIIHESTPTKE